MALLKLYLDGWRADLPAPPTPADRVLVTARGGDPWTEDGFRASWSKVKRDDAGIVGRTFHDLRGTAVLLLAMAGGTEAETATVTGHSLRDVRSNLDKRYSHRDTRLADAGMDKLDAMISIMASPASDAAIGDSRPIRQANGVTGSKRTLAGRRWGCSSSPPERCVSPPVQRRSAVPRTCSTSRACAIRAL